MKNISALLLVSSLSFCISFSAFAEDPCQALKGTVVQAAQKAFKGEWNASEMADFDRISHTLAGNCEDAQTLRQFTDAFEAIKNTCN